MGAAIEKAENDFHAAMDDDFNTPIAIAALYELVKPVNQALAAGDVSKDVLTAARDLFVDLGEGVLGIVGDHSADEGGMAADPFIDLLLAVRTELKQLKSFELADRIRDDLESNGVEVKDTKDGATWGRRA